MTSLPTPPTSPQTQTLRGWFWIRDAFFLLKQQPKAWLMLAGCHFLVSALMHFLPGIGQLLAVLCAPAFLAGFLYAAVGQQMGIPPRWQQLFAGFRLQPVPLLTVGVYYLVGMVLAAIVLGIGLGIWGHSVPAESDALLRSAQSVDGQMTVLLIGFLLFLLPVALAYWLAPALVVFQGLPALRAMWLSLLTALKHWPAVLLYLVLMAALLGLAIIAFGLGLPIWLPVALLTVFTAYCDLFQQATPQPMVPEQDTAHFLD